MKFIFLTALAFFATLFWVEWKKSRKTKGFKDWTKGLILDVKNTPEGVFLHVSWFDHGVKEQKLYHHRLIAQSVEEKHLDQLWARYLQKPFYLALKRENGQVVEIQPFSNAKICRWIYLALAIASLGALIKY